MDVQEVWALLEQHQASNFIPQNACRFAISSVAAALQKIATRQAAGEAITGPQKIGCYGASYLYPMF